MEWLQKWSLLSFGSIWMHSNVNSFQVVSIYLFCYTVKREYYLISTHQARKDIDGASKKCLFNNDKLDFQLTYCLICIIYLYCILVMFTVSSMWIETANWVLYFRFKELKERITPWHMIYVVKSIDCKSQGDRWLNIHQILLLLLLLLFKLVRWISE